MQEPKVSIIVPVYNVEKYIGRCIESIKRQTLKEWELICVDDCSPDKSYDIIESYARDDSRIRILRHDKNHGPMMARQWGNKLAKGEYVTYCDGDDTLPENSLQVLFETAKKSGADIVAGDVIWVSLNGKVEKKQYSLQYGNDAFGCLKSIIRKEMSHILCSKMFKTSLLQDYEYDIIDKMTNAEDLYMFFQILTHMKKMVHVQAFVYNYIQNFQSSTHKKLTREAIRQICFANSYIRRYADGYPSLKTMTDSWVAQSMIDLMYLGYGFFMDEFIYIYELQDCIKNKTIISLFPIRIALKLIIRKYIGKIRSCY